MKKATLVVVEPYTKGAIFDRSNVKLNRDDCLAFFHCLKSELFLHGYDLKTQDMHPEADSELVIYNEMPPQLPALSQKQKSILLIFESELIRPDNWNVDSHSHFKKIFTWHDDFVDNRRYFKFNFTHSGGVRFKKFGERKGFCTLIAGDKSLNHKLELYSERRKIITWFQNTHPDQFEFYGVGWDKYTFSGPIIFRALNKITWLGRAFAKNWPGYLGKVESKLATLNNYKFSICYENARGIPGYITEKIFDSMAAGCVPIYWGAPNIADYVPPICFVDKTEFVDLESLYDYLAKMKEEEFSFRQQAIEKYFQSQKHDWFTPDFVATLIVKNIVSDSP